MASDEPLNPVEVALRRIADALDAEGMRWALVGGLAVSARAEPRTTRDVDAAVSVVDDAEAEALTYRLQALGYRVVALLEHEVTRRVATVRLVEPRGSIHGVVVDLLFASSGIEQEIAASADVLSVVESLAVPVACTGHLIAMKVLSRDDRQRPQDAVDIRALLREADAQALGEARAAFEMISRRGYNRGKNLLDEFERAQQEASEEIS